MDLEPFERLTDRDWDTGTSGSLRFAVVGVGGFARHAALPALAASDYCEPTVFVTGSPASARSIADDYGVSAVVTYDAFADGEAAQSYDAVYVATPNAIHGRDATTAASFGKHVVVEKPLAASVAGAEEIVDTCDEAGVSLMTAYRMQTHPAVRALGRFLDDGGLGSPVHLHGDFTFPVLAGDRGPEHWRLDPDLAGGGALLDVGIYPLNTARFLLDREPTAVSATTSGEGPFAAVDERIAFQLSFGEHVSAAFTASFSGYSGTNFSIVGDRGRVGIESAFEPAGERRITVETDEGSATFDCPAVDEVREEFDYFAHAVLTDGEIEPDGRDGRRDVEIAMAAYEAAARGERIEI
jgi:xylose dehydrogenase (NAD/NADP)